MRRRRGNRATWFPIVPTTYGETLPGVTWYEQQAAFPSQAVPGDTSIIAFPLTLDETVETPGVNGASLRDYVEGQDYLLQRVVGKVWMGIIPADGDSSLLEGVGCCALAVLPSDDNGSPAIPAEEYNPLFSQNAAQPWIWRRTWRLDDPSLWATTAAGNGPPGFTGYYGSNMDGGHLDAKTKRRVVKEHRLYIVFAMGCIQNSGDSPGGNPEGTWYFGYDLRVLGTMRRGKNKSSF